MAAQMSGQVGSDLEGGRRLAIRISGIGALPAEESSKYRRCEKVVCPEFWEAARRWSEMSKERIIADEANAEKVMAGVDFDGSHEMM